MKGVIAVTLILLAASGCEYGEIITPDYDPGCPEVEISDLDRICMAGQLANPYMRLHAVEKVALGGRGARQLILYYWKHFVVLERPGGGQERQMIYLSGEFSDEERDRYITAIDEEREDLSDDYIIELDENDNPITPNEWVQFADEAPRVTDEQIAEFELLFGCLGGKFFSREEQVILRIVFPD